MEKYIIFTPRNVSVVEKSSLPVAVLIILVTLWEQGFQECKHMTVDYICCTSITCLYKTASVRIYVRYLCVCTHVLRAVTTHSGGYSARIGFWSLLGAHFSEVSTFYGNQFSIPICYTGMLLCIAEYAKDKSHHTLHTQPVAFTLQKQL